MEKEVLTCSVLTQFLTFSAVLACLPVPLLAFFRTITGVLTCTADLEAFGGFDNTALIHQLENVLKINAKHSHPKQNNAVNISLPQQRLPLYPDLFG